MTKRHEKAARAADARGPEVWLPRELEFARYKGKQSRPACDRLCGAEIEGRGYVAATDGHRLAMVRSECWPLFRREDQAPFLDVVPWDAPAVGILRFDAFAEARVIPKSWSVWIQLRCDGCAAKPRVKPTPGCAAKPRVKPTPKSENYSVCPFGHAPIEVGWSKLEDIGEPIALELGYLLDALKFLGSAVVQAYNAGPLDPLLLVPVVPGVRTTPEGAQRLAVIMPGRW